MDYEFYLRISRENYLYLYMNTIATINIFDNNISTDTDGKQFAEACQVACKYSEGYSGKIYFSRNSLDFYQFKKRLTNFIQLLKSYFK